MTHDEIMNTPAGAEMDKLIAHQIMGYVNGKKMHKYADGSGKWWTTGIDHYSTKIEDAWKVVWAMEEKGIWFKLANVIPNSDTIVYEVSFGDAYACEDTPPLAICRAALLAVVT
jgi:hypothetical protein